MPPHLESRLRTIKFAYYLKKIGYEVTIISSSFMHNMEIDLISGNDKYIEREYDGLRFIHIKTLKYKGNGFRRFYSLFQFHIKLYLMRKRIPHPDVISHIALPPFGNLIYYCAKKLNSKYIVEVLDLWPESFVAFGLIHKSNPLLKLAYRTERWLYGKADELVFSMEGGRDYIIDKKWDNEHNGPVNLDKVHYINNGVDLTDFEYYRRNYVL